jgi:hypothetical protein
LHAGLCLAFALLISGQCAEPPTRKTKPSAGDDLFTDSAIRRLRIEVSKQGIATLRKYHFERDAMDAERVPVPATVREGDRVYTNVAVHLKGGFGSFRSVDDKPGMTLNFDKLANGQHFHGLQKISLNNSVQDPAFISDKLCRELFDKAGVPVPRADYALVELNGRKLGLYVLSEGWNKQFLHRYFNNTKGNFYDCAYSADVNKPLRVGSGENPSDQSEIKALAAAAAEKNLAKRYARLEQLLDMDRFVTFLALGVLCWDWDGYAMNRNNYRVFHDLDSHRVTFMPHGMDQMFWRPDGPIVTGTKGIVARALLQTPEGRRRYLERVTALRTNIFNIEAMTNRVHALAARIGPAVAEGGLGAAFSFGATMASLNDNIIRRGRSIDEQLAGLRGLLKLATNEAAPLSGWRFRTTDGHPKFDKTASPDALQISASETSAGVWWTPVWLEEGEYVIEAKIKTRDVVAGRRGTRGGAGLHVFSQRKVNEGVHWDWFPYRESQRYAIRGEVAPTNSVSQRVTGTSDWTTVRYEIDLHQPIADLEVRCELSGTGEAWFDRKSIMIRRK